jgi:hypothetical protein
MPLLLSALRREGLVLNKEGLVLKATNLPFENPPFETRPDDAGNEELHEVMRNKDTKVRVVCDTEPKGYETPNDASLVELVVDSSQGFIPLWDKDVTLRWRFRRSTLSHFADPKAARANIELLLARAIANWGDGVPVKFKYAEDAWDFEIVVRQQPQCTLAGCVLASAFFPDAGQHQLFIYPTMFDQPEQEQIETLAHEIGHVFGLRHFFALVKEGAFPAVLWGTQNNFTIMNYGDESFMTDADRADLKMLYEQVWSRELTHIAGTEIRLVRPFHETGSAPR